MYAGNYLTRMYRLARAGGRLHIANERYEAIIEAAARLRNEHNRVMSAHVDGQLWQAND